VRVYVLFAILVMACLVSCTIGAVEPDTEKESALPPITQTGERTFGCLVNGEVWVTKNSIKANAVYQFGVLQIGASIDELERDQSLGLRIDSSIISESVFMIDSTVGQNANAAFNNSTDGCDYDYNDTVDGMIYISKFTLNRPKIVSGTFEFTTVTNNCDTIKVTEGRFDLSLTQ